jgi:acyl-coenzyme A thioesterase PaaI-like protein
MKRNTHLEIDEALCGKVIELDGGRAVVELQTVATMAADEQGLVHGGFIFGAADFAAMAAVNEPTVVLASSSCRFTAPSRVGDVIVFTATVVENEGRKYRVEVVGLQEATAVFKGEFSCVVTPKHVLV